MEKEYKKRKYITDKKEKKADNLQLTLSFNFLYLCNQIVYTFNIKKLWLVYQTKFIARNIKGCTSSMKNRQVFSVSEGRLSLDIACRFLQFPVELFLRKFHLNFVVWFRLKKSAWLKSFRQIIRQSSVIWTFLHYLSM